ncbi:MAG: hypothetical protein BLITH_1580 [Brockia lithotrophica]|uniref:Uncharacterized protein n=1 Tax=Brockia lithotrophica TaxID=933949 RepID=A0A2T5G5Q9_9BACL|nr:MAG: hypothetical protein BLITH_1580 [Brockia lithotrophica]
MREFAGSVRTSPTSSCTHPPIVGRYFGGSEPGLSSDPGFLLFVYGAASSATWAFLRA